VGAHASAGAHVGTYLHVVVRRSTCNVQPSTPRAPRLAPRPKPLRSGGVTRRGRTCQCGRTCRYLPPRCRPTFNVQRATFNPARPSPRPSPQTFEVGRSHPAWAHMPVRAHMSVPTSTLSSDVQRATCNLQPRAPLASPLSPRPPSPHPLTPASPAAPRPGTQGTPRATRWRTAPAD
jgi:hypothetical protein